MKMTDVYPGQAEKPASSKTRLLKSLKIDTQHLARTAIVYVRQSSARQVRENVESTQLQYDLALLAEAYGWPKQRVEIIDEDLGVSGKSIEGRSGFQRLLAEIALEHVGIVMGIEMSRLARNCRDWHQLLELCAVFGTLLGDADGVYNPRDHNDRLLLGLKGTMSEAELHVLRSRLNAGKKNKARRGEHFGEAPIGYVRTRDGVSIEPDIQAQEVVRLIFRKFEDLGSANAVLKYLVHNDIRFGKRKVNGLQPEAVEWQAASRSTILQILRHPIYAGAYVYGRSKSTSISTPEGNRKTVQRRVNRNNWEVLIPDKIPAYITWQQWENNQKKLRENSTKFSFGVSRGSSILTGRIVCGKCGSRMPVHYRDQIPSFECSIARMNYGGSLCQSFNARWLEPMIEELVLQAFEPASIQLSLEAAVDIEADRRRLETHHRRSVERATYETALTRRRYEKVDPDNRLVAAQLESEWESKLTAQRECEAALNRFREQSPAALSSEDRDKIESLANDFRSLWFSDQTSGKDRQDLVRILIEKIVVDIVEGTEVLSVMVHWAGGYQSQCETRRTVATFDEMKDADLLLERAQQLYNFGYPRNEIVCILNNEGFQPARQSSFTPTNINALLLTLRRKGMIGSRPKLPQGFWRSRSLSKELGINPATLTGWRHRSWVQAKHAGRRWIYWASESELERLRKLATHPKSGFEPTPTELTDPVEIMPKKWPNVR
jgi:DNA invertase Pin-like site-specific DNA recombinase